MGLAQRTDSMNGKSVVGNWEGKLTLPGTSLRIRFHIKRNDSGHWTATMDSPDQNAYGIPVSAVESNHGTVTLDVKAIHGVYEGSLSEDYKHLKGTWKQAGQVFPLELQKTSKHDESEEVKRPQEPKPPYPYHSDSVTFQNKIDNVTLAGTLTYPNGSGPFPALILISGSGAQDRDETIADHKPFLVIADYLTRRGFAVLRYDDRGVGGSGGSLEGATTRDLSNDAQSAVRYLSGDQKIDKNRIGLIGHSEGGIQAILLAARDKQIKAVVLLASPAQPGSAISLEQIQEISRAKGVPQDAINKNLKLQKKVLSLSNRKIDSAQMNKEVKEIIKEEFPDMSDSRSESMAQNISSQLLNPWSRYYMTFDPKQTLSKLKIPVLALYGSKDLQVLAKNNAPVARKALAEDKAASVEILNGLNHLFQKANSGLPEEYGQIQQTFSPEALEIIGKWLNVHLK